MRFPVLSLVFSLSVCSLAAQPSLYPYRHGNAWGYCDENKKIIVQPVYNITYPHSDGMGLVIQYDAGQKRYLYGFLDNTGKVIVKPQWASATFFKKDRSVVKSSDGKYGVIDTRGKLIIEPKFSLIVYLEKSELFRVTNDEKKSTLFDLKGKKLFDFKYEEIDDAASGLFAFLASDASGKKYCSWVARTGKEIPVKLGSANEFSEGLAAAADLVTGKYGYVNEKGNWVIAPQYWNAQPFSSGIALVANSQQNTVWLYLDKKGDTLFNKNGYAKADPFRGTLALVDWKFMTTDGAPYLPQYNNCYEFRGGLAEVRNVGAGQANEWYLIDTTGRIIDRTAYSGGSFAYDVSGLILKQDGWKWGIIDRQGKTIAEPKYNRLQFRNGMICNTYQDRNYNDIITGYITEKGVECWDDQ